jgi:predicted enzyme involved in methoxymalonyl-ACP biosynthesis
MILLSDPAEPEVLVIDTWVMSCRVFGRQLELEAMNIAVEAALRRGIRAFRAEYIPTAKNGVVSELFPRLGFTELRRPASTNSGTGWLVNLRQYARRQTHITLRTEA